MTIFFCLTDLSGLVIYCSAIVPSLRLVVRVAHRSFSISSVPRGRTCDVYDRPCEWHRNAIVVLTLLPPVSTAYNFQSSWIRSRTTFLRMLPL